MVSKVPGRIHCCIAVTLGYCLEELEGAAVGSLVSRLRVSGCMSSLWIQDVGRSMVHRRSVPEDELEVLPV